MPSIYDSQAGPGALPTFNADLQQFTRVRQFEGTAGQAAANLFGNLSRQLGTWAQRSAQDVGRQQGLVAGMDPGYRPDADESEMGIARRNAAVATYGNNLEAQGRNAQGDAYEQFKQLPLDQQTPANLAKTFAGIKQDFDQNHVFDAVRPQFDLAWGRTSQMYLRQAQTDQDTRQQDAARASFVTNQNSARDAAMRTASLGTSTQDDVTSAVNQHNATVDNAVNAGLYSAETGAKMKADFQQQVAGQYVWGKFNNVPDAQKPAFAQRFASDYGGGGDYFENLKRNESGYDPTAVNPITHATGLYQFLPSTWAGVMKQHPELGLTEAGITDPEQQEKAMRAFTADNAAALTRAGIQVNNANLYMAHFMGAQGAINFFSKMAENPNQSFASAFPAEAAANASIAGGRSLADVYQLMAKKIGAGAPSGPAAQGMTHGLTTETVTRLQNDMASAIRSNTSQAQHTQKLGLEDIKSDVSQMEKGIDVPEDDWAAKRQLYGASQDPVTADAFDTADKIRTMYAGFKGQSQAAVDAEVADIRGQLAQGATPKQAAIAEAAEKYQTRLHEQLKKDPLSRAAADGIIPPQPPLDFSSPQSTMRSLRGRVAAADQVAEHYGVRAPLATPDDRETVKNIAAEGGEPMIQAAGAISAALGPRAAQFWGEVGGDTPAFAHMGILAAQAGDPGVMRDAAWAIAQDHQQGSKVQRPTAESTQQAIANTYGDAFKAMPNFAQGAKMLADSALAAQIMRGGLDPKNLGDTLVAQTLQKAAGATFIGGVQYGGVAKAPLGWGSQQVLAPTDVRADQLKSVIGMVNDKDLAAMPNPPRAADGSLMPAAALGNLHYTSLGPGVYALSAGDPFGEDPQWVTSRPPPGAGGGEGDRPAMTRFVLDLNALAPQLRQRIPGAYK